MRFLTVALIAALTTSVLAADKGKHAPGAYNLDLSRYDFIDTTQNRIQVP